MRRFTAMRTAKIAAAVVGPLMLMLYYLTQVYEWLSGYWLVLFFVFWLVCYAPALCSDPIAEDEAARNRPGKKGFYILCALMGAGWGFGIPWLLGHPEVRAFLSSLKPHLRDWKPTTAVALLCLMWMRWGLRKAQAFKITDLYPHLRRTGQAGRC